MSGQHFVFVHGAGHGGWCWYKLANSLRESGHKATCIDLKGAGINLTDPNRVSTLYDYDQPLYAFLSQLPLDHKVILVSHSVGGGSITAAMCLFPSKVSMAVYVAAAMIKPGSLAPASLINICLGKTEDQDEEIWDYTYGDGLQNPPTSVIMKPEYVRDKYYNESPMEVKFGKRIFIHPAFTSLGLHTGDDASASGPNHGICRNNRHPGSSRDGQNPKGVREDRHGPFVPTTSSRCNGGTLASYSSICSSTQ